jgi:hypothetical protein
VFSVQRSVVKRLGLLNLFAAEAAPTIETLF